MKENSEEPIGAADTDTRKPAAPILKTPQGQFVTESPETTNPSTQHDIFGYWGQWLGNPTERYGHLVSSATVPTTIKLQMLMDNVVALCVSFVGNALLNARREIVCKDAEKQRFFEAAFRKFEREFILQASVGIALGSLGLVKRWRFETPQFTDAEAAPVWQRSATPYVITGFDMVYPLGGSPKFDEKLRHFRGIETAQDGTVDEFHSLWLTFRKELAFGNYNGVGRLSYAYKAWWLKNFGTDLYVVALQKEANRVVKMTYPPGVDSASGKQNRLIALEVGDKVRSGATVAIPSDNYTTLGLDGEERQSSAPKWGIEFLQGASNFDNFFQMEDQSDKKICIGYIVPPQAMLEVTGGQLGSVTSAEDLSNIAISMIMRDATDIDTHVNKYVFPAMSKANFPEGSAPVEVHTVGLDPDNRAMLNEIIKAIIPTAADAKYFDLRGAMERLGFPLKTEEQLSKENSENKPKPQPSEPTEEPGEPTEEPATAVAGEVNEEGRVTIQGSPLKPWPEKDVVIEEKDVEEAMNWWRDMAPRGSRGLLDAEEVTEEERESLQFGGPGSGNFGHAGRQGVRGGSGKAAAVSSGGENPTMSEARFDEISSTFESIDEDAETATIRSSVSEFFAEKEPYENMEDDERYLTDVMYQWAQDSNSRYAVIAQVAAGKAFGAHVSEYTDSIAKGVGIERPDDLVVDYLKYVHSKQSRPMTLYRGHTGEVHRNALESWTEDKEIAEYFAIKNNGLVEKREFAASDILGTYRDGVGLPSASEVVVINRGK